MKSTQFCSLGVLLCLWWSNYYCQGFQIYSGVYNSFRCTWSRCPGRKEIGSGIYEVSGDAEGKVPFEIARYLKKNKGSNLREKRQGNDIRERISRADQAEETRKPKSPHLPRGIKKERAYEDNDDVSIEELEKQLAFETGIGRERFLKEDASSPKNNKRFHSLSDSIMNDKTRFQGFGSTQPSMEPEKNGYSLGRSRDYVLRKPHDDERLRTTNGKVNNPLITKGDGTRKSTSSSSIKFAKLSDKTFLKDRGSYNEDESADDDYDDYDYDEEDESLGHNSRHPLSKSSSKRLHPNKDDDGDDDDDALLEEMRQKYHNNYLFDYENPADSSAVFSQRPPQQQTKKASKHDHLQASKTNQKPLTIFSTPPDKDYKQRLNEEFYRMRKPNLTEIRSREEEKRLKKLQKSMTASLKSQRKQQQIELSRTSERGNSELNTQKFIPFQLNDSILLPHSDLFHSLPSSKQLYCEEDLRFEDILLTHPSIQEEYYSSKPNDQSHYLRYQQQDFYELLRYVNDNLETMKITIPTKIQAIAIPSLIIGQNTILHAQTGSGKTLAFLLPLLYHVNPEIDRVQAIILAPSRELVTQIHRVFEQLYDGTNYRAIPIIGGANIKSQLNQLREKKPQVIVATPGRLAEIVFKYQKLSLQGIQTMIIDEADNLLQEPFQNEIKTIIEATPFLRAKMNQIQSSSISSEGMNPKGNAEEEEGLEKEEDNGGDGDEEGEEKGQRTSKDFRRNVSLPSRKFILCLASATANNNPTVTAFMEEYSVRNTFQSSPSPPITASAATTTSITSTSETTTKPLSQSSSASYIKAIVNHAGMLPSTITHAIISCPRIKVYEMLKKFLQAKPEINRALIFVNDPYKVETVYQRLLEYGFIVAPLHGDSSKDDRKDILHRLRDGRLRLVVTTELSARGLDIPDVTHVINLELPTDSLHYVHRVGRCGRAGKAGLAMNFCTPETKFVIRRFGKQLGTKVYDCELREGQVFLKMI